MLPDDNARRTPPVPDWATITQIEVNMWINSPARVVFTTNVTISSPFSATYDGVTLRQGDRVLLTAQTSALQNGLWDVGPVVAGVVQSLTRSSDFGSGRSGGPAGTGFGI